MGNVYTLQVRLRQTMGVLVDRLQWIDGKPGETAF